MWRWPRLGLTGAHFSPGPSMNRQLVSRLVLLWWSLFAAGLTVGCPAARIDYSYEEHVALSKADTDADVWANLPGASAAAGAQTAGAAGAATSEPGSGGTPGVNPPSGTGGQPAAAPDAAAPANGPDANSDHAKICACATPACPAGYAQMSDDFYTLIDPEKSKCLMAALSASSPGLYLHNTGSLSSAGEDSTEHAFLVGEDGTVVHTSERITAKGQFALQGTEGTTYEDAERCELAGSSYFDDCAAAIRDDAPAFTDKAWACLFTDPATVWITNCQPAEPSCS